MKQKENKLLIDVLKILPENIECFIQAPSLDIDVVNEMLQSTNYDYYKIIHLNNKNKNNFINQELETSFSTYIQKIEIKKNEGVLFEGYDGMEYGIISARIFVPQWFKKRYIPDICIVSSDW